MAAKQTPVEPVVPAVPEGESVDLGDSAASLYRDRSGKALGGPHSEGKSNFGAITAAAIESVRLASEQGEE